MSTYRGFSLIEMVVVVIIIGVLMVAGIPRLLATQERARDAKRKTDIASLANALVLFKSDRKVYPTGTWLGNVFEANGIYPLVPQYLTTIPQDITLRNTPVYLGIQKDVLSVANTAISLQSSGHYGYVGLYAKDSLRVKSFLLMGVVENISSANWAVPEGAFVTPTIPIAYAGVIGQFQLSDAIAPGKTIYFRADFGGDTYADYDDEAPIASVLCRKFSYYNVPWSFGPPVPEAWLIGTYDKNDCQVNNGYNDGFLDVSKVKYRYIYAN